MVRISIRWKLVLASAGLALMMGCSTTSTSAPFHMYSSPLLEGEMEPPRAGADQMADSQVGSPGVKPRQVYVYQRWNADTAAPMPRQRRQVRPAGSRPSGPPLDTVVPSSEPVLANYNSGGQPTGAGRAVDDDGASPDAPTASLDDEQKSDDDEVVEESKPAPREEPDEAEYVEENPAPTDEADYAAMSAAYIHATLAANGVEFDDEAAQSIPALYRSCRAQGEIYHSNSPNIGDVAFFHNTYDANGDGRNNNWYTLVGIVQSVHLNGTVDFLTYRGDSVEELHLNIDQLDLPAASGKTLNTELRQRSADDAPFTQYLAGQLFAGYCNILGDRQELVLIDNWTPGMDVDAAQR